MPTTVNDTITAVADGSEKPCQRPTATTSYGRGRLNALIRLRPITTTTTTLPRNVNRCRQRRKNAVTTSRTTATKNIVHPVATRSRPLASVVIQSVRRLAISRRMKASTWSVTRRAPGDCNVTTSQRTRTTSAAIQPRPDRPMLRGSGGGAPEGRRMRRMRRTLVGTGGTLSTSESVDSTTGSGSASIVTARTPSTTPRRPMPRHRRPCRLRH